MLCHWGVRCSLLQTWNASWLGALLFMYKFPGVVCGTGQNNNYLQCQMEPESDHEPFAVQCGKLDLFRCRRKGALNRSIVERQFSRAIANDFLWLGEFSTRLLPHALGRGQVFSGGVAAALWFGIPWRTSAKVRCLNEIILSYRGMHNEAKQHLQQCGHFEGALTLSAGWRTPL